jgi:photoactive yellow protein
MRIFRGKSVVMTFNIPQAFQILETMNQTAMDQEEFGIVRMNRIGKINAYNKYELELSGHQLHEVLDKDFFQQIAPCTNNFMVAERYQSKEVLDEEMDYVFTYRMQPTKVKLRLLASPEEDNQYLLVKKVE